MRANHNDTAKITESLIQKWPTKLSDSYDKEIKVDSQQVVIETDRDVAELPTGMFGSRPIV